MAKIGFIVPVYNVKNEYLQYCIESLCNQTFKDIEIIIVDDHSTEESASFCDYLVAQDERIKVYHHDVNKGLPGARNTGIDNSTADWLAFIDGDDWVESDMAEKLVEEIKNCDADIFVYSGYRNYSDSELCCSHIFDHRMTFDTPEKRNGFEEAFLFNQTIAHVGHSFPIQSACIRLVSRKLFDKGLRFIDVKFAEDALFHLYSTESADKVVYLQYNFYHYRNTENSMVNSYRENADKEQTDVVGNLWTFVEKYGKDEHFQSGVYLLAFSAMQMCIWQKFFHSESPCGYFENRKKCKTMFDEKPFKGTLKNIKYSELRKKQKIKYILIKFKLYKSVALLRGVNEKKVH